MLHELILANVAKHISLTDDEKGYFISFLTQTEVSKKKNILTEGQICKTINFVHSGMLRAFYVDKDGKESTIMFAVADWWITDMYCFINQLPAMLNIETINTSIILQLQKSDLEKLYSKIPKFEKFFRILMQNAYIREQLRIIESLSLSAEQRFDNFVTKYPLIASNVTQKQIASYLGITPEFLSAIRNKKSKRQIS